MKGTNEQKEYLKDCINNLEQILLSDDVNDLLLEIDDAITDTFDADGNPNEIGRKLGDIYDSIYVERHTNSGGPYRIV